MKGNIDEKGRLWVDRAGVMKKQQCPYVSSSSDGTICGNWCPLFGEPTQYYSDGVVVANGKTILTLCHKTLIFDQFTDERVGGEDA